MHLSNGTELQGGKYKIIRFINSGGFGCTYEAEHVMLKKKIAIKEFFVKDFCNRDELTSHVTVGTQSKKALVEKLLWKFVDEARALGKFKDRGIVSVSDVFKENGTAYFVMNFIEGESLDEKIKKHGALDEATALHYIYQVAEALKYVHANNRLHLDIKPANIMVDSDDHAVLIDFGASKQYDEENGENTSSIMGKTPGYAPPEQMGNDVTKFMPATDIYALGATLYKLLTGSTPVNAILLVSGDEKLKVIPDNISLNTRNAVAEAMKLNKSQRPQSIDEFVNILEGKYNREETEPLIVDVKPSNDDKKIQDPEKKEEKPGEHEDDKGGGKKKIALDLFAGIVIVLLAVMIFKGSGSDNNDDAAALDSISKVIENKAEEKNSLTYMEKVKITNSNKNTFTYTGNVNSENMPEGKGKGVYKDGTYEGYYVNGVREGKATYVTSDGSNKFEGTYYNDKYNKGRLTFDDGSYYEGTFSDNYYYDGTFYTKTGKKTGKMVKGKSL